MNIKQKKFQIFFLQIIVLWCIRKVQGVYNFSKKYWFLRSLWFLENENFAARAMHALKLQIFWNWVPKNKPDQQKCVGFQKSKKITKSLHPIVHPYLWIKLKLMLADILSKGQ